jgi:hypothetical protein
MDKAKPPDGVSNFWYLVGQLHEHEHHCGGCKRGILCKRRKELLRLMSLCQP